MLLELSGRGLVKPHLRLQSPYSDQQYKCRSFVLKSLHAASATPKDIARLSWEKKKKTKKKIYTGARQHLDDQILPRATAILPPPV